MSLIRNLISVVCLVALAALAPVVAQVKNPDAAAEIKKALAAAEEEYRTLFAKPQKVVEYWAAINYEITVGKFDVAALHLDQLLKKEPKDKVDEELLKIEEAEGLASFVRLQNVRKWYESPELHKKATANVDDLIKRVLDALEVKLSDPVRIHKFIKNLSAPTREERAFALMQIDRSRERAGPYLVEALRNAGGTLAQQRIQEAILKLDGSAIPPMLEALHAADDKDAQETDLRLALLDIVKRRLDTRAVPYLWHMSSAPKYPAPIRAKAKETLAYLLRTDAEALPPAKVALTQLAEDHYQHKIRYGERYKENPKWLGMRVWRWTGKDIEPKPLFLRANEAEEDFGLRYAKQAIELDPGYRPAQIIYLTLKLEREFQVRLDQFFLSKGPTGIEQLLATLDTELLTAVLERALSEHNVPVILPLVQTLGERGEVRTIKPASGGAEGVLLRTLYYPDRRVQFAAAQALLRMPTAPVPVAATRTVEVLRRFVACDTTPKVLLAFFGDGQAPDLQKALKEGGFTPVLAASLKETMAKLRDNADIDVILLNHTLAENELPFVLSQLRADRDIGLLPLLLLAPAKRESALNRMAGRHRNVSLLPEATAANSVDLKDRLETAIKFAAVSDVFVRAPEEQRSWLELDVRESKGQKLADQERKLLRRGALDQLWRMARGELPGYELLPVEETVARALRTEELAVPALEILSRLPAASAQDRLAAFVLDPARGKLRVAAAFELNRHAQKHGVVLSKDQLKRLQKIHKTPAEDPILRNQVALLIGSLRSTPQQTGQRLLDPPEVMPPKKE